jgi:hypothetical protein
MILLSEFRFVKYWVASWGERAIPDSQRDLRMVSPAGWIVGSLVVILHRGARSVAPKRSE